MAKITGKIVYIYPTQQLQSKSGNAFQKRDFVIAVQTFDRDTGEPVIDEDNIPLLSLTGDRCAQLDTVRKGDIVTVDFYLRGRRYRGDDNREKIINDINVTSVRLNAARPMPEANPPQAIPVDVSSAAVASDVQPKDPADDLPF